MTMELDQSRVEAFGERLLAMLNSGALALMTSVGHRTGLFDVMAQSPAASSAQIAAWAGLQERYVREWLGAMVTGGFVEYDAPSRTYRLPAEHAALLTRAASPNNLAAIAQFIPQLGQVEDPIIHCFQHGGGVPYEQFTHFHRIMAEDSGQTVVAALFDHILPLVPGLSDQLTAGIDVLDIGCGSGRAMNTLAEAFPASRFSGYDFSEQAIANALQEATDKGLENVVFEVKEASQLIEIGCYDVITAFDAIHDQGDPARVLREIHTALRPDGVFLMQDIRASSELHRNMDHPVAPLLYTVSCMHCTTVSLAQGGAGLGAMWGEEMALSMLADAGFQRVEVKQLEHDFQNNYYLARKA